MTDGTPHDHSSPDEGSPDCPGADANESARTRPMRRAPDPPWLGPADVQALAQRFAPLDLAQAHHVGLLLAEGSTPVEILILKLVAAGLAPCDARRFIAELRALRERARLQPRPGAASPGAEVDAALRAAARSYLLDPGDDERAARAIATHVKWSIVRARWFVSVNRDKVRRMVDKLAPEHPTDN